MQIHNFNKTRLIIEKADAIIAHNSLMSDRFYKDLFDVKKIQITIRRLMSVIERTKNPLLVSNAEYVLGYTKAEFVSHIERQFTSDMSWVNRSEWHIDHIIPISKFIKMNILDIKKINCLSNLKPILAKENLRKGAKVMTLV